MIDKRAYKALVRANERMIWRIITRKQNEKTPAGAGAGTNGNNH